MIGTNINNYIIFIALTIFFIIIVVINNSQEKFQNSENDDERLNEMLLLKTGRQNRGVNLGNSSANDDEILISHIEKTLNNKKCVFEDREETEKCIGSDDDSYICKEYDDLKPYEKDTYIEIKRIKQLIKLHGIKSILDKINTLDS